MATPESIHFLNGKFVEEKDLVIPIRDLGFTRGYAVFDFLITYQGRPFLLSQHVDRLMNSANLIGLVVPWSKDKIIEWVLQTLAKNSDDTEKSIKIIISGGISDSLLPTPGAAAIAIIIDRRHTLPAEYYEKGVGAITVYHTRHVPEAKSNNYVEAVKQAQLAEKIKAIEPIYYNDKQVFEGASSNVFAVIKGKLMTPKSNILSGITRDVLLDILTLDIPIKVADFSIEQLRDAEEIFLVASNKEILPVTMLDGKMVNKGLVGETTKEAMK